MPKIHLDKSVLADASAEKVYAVISDFHNWKPCSPWMITDPSTKLKINEDGKYYEWIGDITGTGNMTVLSEKENEQVDYDLLFLKPFKSKAKVSFILKPEGNGTRVHWTMDSSLPFFMFWMKKMMVTFVGMDYDRGLRMLKEFVEVGKVNSELTFKGIQTFEGGKYVGIERTCTFKGISSAMSEDYTKLMEFIMGTHKDKITGPSFSIYSKFNPLKDHVVYTACVPVSETITDLLDGMEMRETQTTQVISIHHKGPYKYSGNVWTAQYSMQRAKKFKLNKKLFPMEIYLNSPKDTPELELESEVVFPVI
ncbi:MAG: effector-binding domain-containing protein [Salibacteraceae bacterium]|jgi:effector-binding domain-containing protein